MNKYAEVLSIFIISLLFSTLLLPAAGWSDPLQEPKVDYSADSTMEMEGGMTMKSPDHFSPRRRRAGGGGGGGGGWWAAPFFPPRGRGGGGGGGGGPRIHPSGGRRRGSNRC